MAYRDIHTASLYAEDEEISKAWESWALQRKCIHCGAFFTTFNSFGRRQCNQHYKEKELCTERDGRYGEQFKCCGAHVPLPRLMGPGSIMPCSELLDQFSCTPYNATLPLPKAPAGCISADCTDEPECWPIGLVDFENRNSEYYITKDYVRPVGGWKINDIIRYNGDTFQIRSPPNPFGEVRVEYVGGPTSQQMPTELHVKDMRPPYDFNVNEYKTLEIFDETGKVSDKISKIGDCWRKWSAGVMIPDIAGILPYMVQKNTNDIYGPEVFAEREGVNPEIPVVWRINVPNKK